MPVCLNADRTWAEVGAIVTDPSTGSTVRDAFREGFAEKVLLPAGTMLYKFNDYNTLHGPDPAAAWRPVSPWWSPYNAYRHDPGWHEKLRIAKHFRVSVREWGRHTSAVKENWNSLRYLLVITLRHDAYAFFGGFAHMDRIDPGPDTTSKRFGNEARGRGSRLPGGGTQFYLPNLRPANIANWYPEPLDNL